MIQNIAQHVTAVQFHLLHNASPIGGAIKKQSCIYVKANHNSVLQMADLLHWASPRVFVYLCGKVLRSEGEISS